MRNALLVAALAGVFSVVVYATAVQDKKVVVVDSAKAEYKSVAPGAAMAVVHGDPEKGRHSAFVKFDPGTKFEMHSHSSDMRLVVIKGAYVYKGKNGDEHRVGPGMSISIPGGDHHWSGGDEKEGALFYQESDGKFDLIPDKK